ncbi:RNA polymerase sigma factor [Oligoflexus tunisiensis]|uniref:RNA polymerase sigma factor n=1 Tax=Oligoflexus tunisiensis TaxID=708132 RepID=UPI00159EF812|nr:sigma-70 family RNA polymerase sigma factor [Oligoflexus tunisiensis]
MQTAKLLSPDPFVPLYHNYIRLVASIAANFPLSPQQQEEICQDVFFIVWQHREQLVHERALSSWLSTITRHRCLTELRRNRSMVALDDLNEEILHAQQEARLGGSTPSQSWHLELSLRLLQSLIDDHRSPVRRRVAQLFYSQGESVATISATLNMCPNTVLSHLRRFRLIVEKSLLRLLEERDIDLAS